MEKVHVPVTYDPVSGAWTATNPVKVEPGVTSIVWTIELVDDAAGAIAFGTEPDFPGIVFDAGWPGTRPKGDGKTWQVTLNDTLKPGDPPQFFHYTINSWYTPGDRALPPQPVSWDPDVEEGGGEPPP